MIDLNERDNYALARIAEAGALGKPVGGTIPLSTAVRLEGHGFVVLTESASNGAAMTATVTPKGAAFSQRVTS